MLISTATNSPTSARKRPVGSAGAGNNNNHKTATGTPPFSVGDESSNNEVFSSKSSSQKRNQGKISYNTMQKILVNAVVVVVVSATLLLLWVNDGSVYAVLVQQSIQERSPHQQHTGGGSSDGGGVASLSFVSSPSSSNSCMNRPNIIHNHTTLLTDRPCQPIVVAYAVSMIKCGDFQSTPEGLVDAALVMRHSIHHTSFRAGTGVSNYDYKMYAIVHEQARECSHILRDAGFEVLIKNRPVEQKDIQGEYLRKYIHREWCCGHDEFIKLYAYTLLEPIVVHVDMDFVFVQPMDDVFDALLFHKDSLVGRRARARIARERPTDRWPDQPQAMMTRDWGQVLPGRKPGYQAGFIVLRPNSAVLDEIVDIVKLGDYVDGFQRENGWGGKGYGGFVGAKAMQGLLAYYYDIKAPDTWVELNQCRYNHMGMDIRYRPGGPAFRPGHPSAGRCRNDQETCEDCMITPIQNIFNIHYTQCRKPWMCIGMGDSTLPRNKNPRQRTRAEKALIPEGNVHLDHCMKILKLWHNHRSNLEQQLQQTAGANMEAIVEGEKGHFKKQFFNGHCSDNGHYLTLASGHVPTLKLIPQLYTTNSRVRGIHLGPQEPQARPRVVSKTDKK